MTRLAQLTSSVILAAATAVIGCSSSTDGSSTDTSNLTRPLVRGYCSISCGSFGCFYDGACQFEENTGTCSSAPSSDCSGAAPQVVQNVCGRSVGRACGSAPSGTTSAQIAKLRTLTQTCNQVSAGRFALDANGAATVPICGLNGAVFWNADMDVDCDGKTTTQCNSSADPDYQNQTAATDSSGAPLDAANLPYVVVPGASSRFNPAAAGLHFGDVVLVVYGDKFVYAVYGDIGPSAIIGEASYATAKALGINADPSTGGLGSADVLYVAFTGTGAIASPIENHTSAVTLGQKLLTNLVGP